MSLRLRPLQSLFLQIRSASSSSKFDPQKDYVVTANEGRTIVCWHPEKEFPYECSLPLPEKIDKIHPYLALNPKISHVFEKQDRDKVIKKLAEITFTCKHRWYPRARDKYVKRNTPDRKFL